MRKIFYLDRFLLVSSVILYAIFIRNINDTIKNIIFILFVCTSIYISIKMSIVVKYPPKNKLSLKERLNAFLLILGKFSFILMIIRFGYFDSNVNDTFVLIIFLVNGLLILNYSYIYNRCLIILNKNRINIDEICKFEIKQNFGQYYVYSYTNKKEKINFNLSEYEYNQWKQIKSM